MILRGDSVSLMKEELEDNSIDLIITSPPYNVSLDYDKHEDGLSYEKYLEFSKEWLEQCHRVSKPDGRMCLNIPLDKNKGGQEAVYSDLLQLCKEIGWKYKTTIIWNEQNISRRTAWGSWKSASAPHVIAPVEMILVMYKENWKKLNKGESDVERDEFIQWTNGVWTFNGEKKKNAGGHPAAFPIELPKRCLKLFSYVGAKVLDPFLGSGTTGIACEIFNREWVGIELSETYCQIAEKRIESARAL